MIEYLRIKDLGVIAEAELELSPGLVAVTGETGAGKTMIMTALDLLFGGKANQSIIRAGAGRAEVEAGIRVSDPAGLSQQHGLDLDPDDEVLILGRSVTEQRSRAWLAGRGVPASVLQELGDDLVVRHGQNDQRRLSQSRYRRNLVDRYAGAEHLDLLESFRSLYDRIRLTQDELDQLRARVTRATERAELLRHGVAEIEAAAPTPGEDDQVKSAVQRLEQIVDVRQATAQAHESLAGDDGSAGTVLGLAEQQLRRAARFDSELESLADLVAEALTLVTEAAGSLAGRLSEADADPARLDDLQQRLAQLNGLKRKYGPSLADVLAWAEKAAADLDTVDTAHDRLGDVQARLHELSAAAAETGARLTAARTVAAERLGDDVTAELTALAMPHARLLVSVHGAQDETALRRDGYDDIEFGFLAHTGAPARPIEQGASGGEMSRVMLALEVALSGAHPVGVFVFDEVDAGIGGRAAVEVGQRLAALARRAQVIVVTHLPQVAAFADQQLLVSKQPDGQVTASSVITLDPQQRRRELARMMAGQDDSSSAVAHADELIDLAAAARARI